MTTTINLTTLEKLSDFELKTFSEHLKQGEEHLKKILTLKQYENLLALSQLSHNEKTSIKADLAEKSGNIAIAINMVLTTLTGTWVGFIGFLGFEMNSPTIISFILVCAVIISIISGYINYQSVKEKAAQSAIKKKISNIRVLLLKVLRKRSDHHIQNKINSLNKLLKYIYPEVKTLFKFEKPEEITGWHTYLVNGIKQFSDFINQERYALHLKEINNTLHQLNKNLNKDSFIHNLLSYSNTTEENTENYPPSPTEDVISVLTSPFIFEKNNQSASFWQAFDLKTMILFLPSTALGGFSLLFIYFDGIPKLLQQTGFEHLHNIMTNAIAKAIELIIAFLITIYFAYTHIHNYKKTAERTAMETKSLEQISNQEHACIEAKNKIDALNYLIKSAKKIRLLIKLMQVTQKNKMQAEAT